MPMASDSERQSLCMISDYRRKAYQEAVGKQKFAKRQPGHPGVSQTDRRWLEIYATLEAIARPMDENEYVMLFSVMKTRLNMKHMNETETRIFHNVEKEAYKESLISYHAAYKGFIKLIRTTPGMSFVPVPADIISAGLEFQKEIIGQRDALRDIFTNVKKVKFR